MTRTHTWRKQLVRTPYPEPVEADVVLLPYRTLGDYQAIESFAKSDLPAAVLLGYFQYYRLLADVVKVLSASLPIDGPVFVEISRPLGVALPVDLLADGILVTDDTEPQARWWAERNVSRFVQIKSRIRRDLHEFGDNTLTVVLHSRVDTDDPLPEILGRSAFADAFDFLAAPVGPSELPDAAATEHVQ